MDLASPLMLSRMVGDMGLDHSTVKGVYGVVGVGIHGWVGEVAAARVACIIGFFVHFWCFVPVR